MIERKVALERTKAHRLSEVVGSMYASAEGIIVVVTVVPKKTIVDATENNVAADPY